jgi:hypothetical protein
MVDWVVVLKLGWHKYDIQKSCSLFLNVPRKWVLKKEWFRFALTPNSEKLFQESNVLKHKVNYDFGQFSLTAWSRSWYRLRLRSLDWILSSNRVMVRIDRLAVFKKKERKFAQFVFLLYLFDLD